MMGTMVLAIGSAIAGQLPAARPICTEFTYVSDKLIVSCQAAAFHKGWHNLRLGKGALSMIKGAAAIVKLGFCCSVT